MAFDPKNFKKYEIEHLTMSSMTVESKNVVFVNIDPSKMTGSESELQTQHK